MIAAAACPQIVLNAFAAAATAATTVPLPTLLLNFPTGLPKGASVAEIKKAYRRLAATAHPDKPGGNPEKFKAISKAAEVLERLAGGCSPSTAMRPPKCATPSPPQVDRAVHPALGSNSPLMLTSLLGVENWMLVFVVDGVGGSSSFFDGAGIRSSKAAGLFNKGCQ